MCHYWVKLHTCSCKSINHIAMCPPGRATNEVCHSIKDTNGEDDIRSSYFPCYDCIRREVAAETKAAALKTQEDVQAAKQAAEKAAREKKDEENRRKTERIRKEAAEKARREREEEVRKEAEMRESMRRAKEEGGTWTEANSRRGKGRKGAFGGGSSLGSGNILNPPLSAGPFTAKKDYGAQLTNLFRENGPKSASLVEGNSSFPSGRAGVWGPPKILTRKENEKRAIDEVDTKWK